MPTELLAQVVNYLLFLVGIAAGVTILIEQFKPILLDKLREATSENLYLAVVYVVRTVAAWFGIEMFGGITTLTGLVPVFANVPAAGVLFGSSLLVAFGTEVLHVFLDFLYALRDGQREDGGGSLDSLLDLIDNMPTPPSAPTAPAVTGGGAVLG